MRAYFVHDARKDRDHLVIPDLNVLADVDRSVLEQFIAARPDFTRIQGTLLNDLTPSAFGQIIATRDDDGDVCIADPSLWRRRMQVHLG